MKKLKQKYRCIEELKYGNGKTTGCPTKTLGHDRQCGFTLVELVIVIAIVIILSVISVPIYRGYVDKAKWAEGYALLGTILSAQKAYYSEHGNFLAADHSEGSFSGYEKVLGIDARGNKYYTSFHYSSLSGTVIPASTTSIGACAIGKNDGEINSVRLKYNLISGGTYHVDGDNGRWGWENW